MRTATRPTADSRGRTAALLSIILALALGLRVWGVNWGLPSVFHADEEIYVDRAINMVQTGDPNPRYFTNPSLLTYLISAELLVVRQLGRLAGPLAANAPGSANLLARLDSALVGTATIALVYMAGARLFSRKVGLVAALFLAVAFLHVRDSHYGVSDVPATGLLLLSFYFDVRLLRHPDPRWYVLAGLTGGLATSTKYSMGLFFAPLLVAHWLASRRPGRRPWDQRSLLALSLAGASSMAGYLIGTPYTLLESGRFWREFTAQSQVGEEPKLGQPPEPVPLLYLTTLLQGFGAVPLGLALVGLALAWRRRPAETLLPLVFPAVYLAFMMQKEWFTIRLAVPLLPFFCLIAAVGTVRLTARLRPAWQSSGLIALIAAAVVQSLANDVLHNRLLLQRDTRLLANDWVQANLPQGSYLKVERYSLDEISPHEQSPPGGGSRLRIERLDGVPGAEQARYLLERNVHYVATSTFTQERCQKHVLPRSREADGFCQRSLHPSIEQRAELLAVFSGGHGGIEVRWRPPEGSTPFWRLEEYDRPGPTVRIYSLAPLAAGRP